jgi:WD40 repeat protein/tRNA A-37 threonylcarbamoyl transferase component Bud32
MPESMPPQGGERNLPSGEWGDSATLPLPVTVPDQPPPDPAGGTLTPSHPAVPVVGVDGIPGYEILGELGRGGMGVVYKARHLRLNRVVALKMILAGRHAGSEERQRFHLEAEAVARAQHPNIVQIHEVGEHNGLPFFVLEFCGGGSLADRFDGTPLPPREAAALVETLARAMHAAHQQQVVHRDLKPANVLLSAEGQPKISDFGLARKLDEAGQTQSGSVLGTPSYMAPEQAAGKTREIGPAADIYALGAILYEGLTGRPPFKAAAVMDTVHQVIQLEPLPPAQLAPGVPRDLETICLKCLQKEPHRRYPTALELADELARFRNGETIRARPVGRVERTWRWCKRNPVVAGLLAAVAFSLFTGTLVATLFAWRARVEAGHARDERAAAEGARADAQRAAEDSRQRLVRLNIATGANAVETGDLWTGLIWYSQAWQLDLGNREQESSHRLRLAGLLERLPRLEGACFHAAPVLDAVFDPEGKRVLTRTTESQAYLWDPVLGEQATPPFRHDGRVRHAGFSPDGRAVVTCSADRTARLWNADTGRPLLPPLTHPADVYHAAFSPDGRLLATACADGKVRLWATATGKAIGPVIDVGAAVSYVLFSPDGQNLLTATETNQARVWSVADGKPRTPPVPHFRRQLRWLGETLSQDVDPVFQPAPGPGPGGNSLAFVTFWGGPRLWAVADGKLLHHFGANKWERTVHLSFRGDGKQLLVLTLNSAHLCDPASGRRLPRMVHPREVGTGCFSPDGSRIATASSGGLVHLWDAASRKELIRPFRQSGEISRVRFAPDGQRLLVAGTDGTARVWRVDPNQAAPRPFNFCPGSGSGKGNGKGKGNSDRLLPVARPNGQSAVYCADGRREVRYGGTGRARVYENPSGREAEAGAVLDHAGVTFARFSPDGRRVLTATPGEARVWDADTGRMIGPGLSLAQPLVAAHFDAAGRRLLLAQAGGHLQVREVDTGRALLGPLRQLLVEDADAGPANVTAVAQFDEVAFSLKDGLRVAASGGGFKLVRVYEVDTGRTLSPPVHDGLIPGLEFSPDGRRVLSGSSDTTARIWDAETGRPLLPPLRHPTYVRSAAFSPDGRRAATCDGDGVVRVWDAATGDLLQPPAQHPAKGWCRVWFSSDGRRVIAQHRYPPHEVVEWSLPRFRVAAERVPALVRLLTGRRMDATGGIVPLSDREVREQANLYRAALLDWKASAD